MDGASKVRDIDPSVRSAIEVGCALQIVMECYFLQRLCYMDAVFVTLSGNRYLMRCDTRNGISKAGVRPAFISCRISR